jgi:hypothetical protein
MRRSEYLERAEMEALLKSIDRRTALGRRDYALFALMFQHRRTRAGGSLTFAAGTCGSMPPVRFASQARGTRSAFAPYGR